MIWIAEGGGDGGKVNDGFGVLQGLFDLDVVGAIDLEKGNSGADGFGVGRGLVYIEDLVSVVERVLNDSLA